MFPSKERKQQNPNRAKITRIRAKPLRLDPPGKTEIINDWLIHQAKPSGTKMKPNSIEEGLEKKDVVLTGCCSVERSSILNSKTGTGTDPRCCSPPS